MTHNLLCAAASIALGITSAWLLISALKVLVGMYMNMDFGHAAAESYFARAAVAWLCFVASGIIRLAMRPLHVGREGMLR